MLYHLLFTLLVGKDYLLPRVVLHEYRAGLELLEVSWFHLPQVYEGECEPIRKDWTKLFHEIERESGPTRAVAMKKAHLWVEPNAFQRTTHVVDEKRVDE